MIRQKQFDFMRDFKKLLEKHNVDLNITQGDPDYVEVSVMNRDDDTVDGRNGLMIADGQYSDLSITPEIVKERILEMKQEK